MEGDDFLPPPPSHPPRLLTDSQILTLAQQGHLPLTLPKHLSTLYAQLDEASTSFFSLPTTTKSTLYSPANQTELGFVSIPNEKEYLTFRATTNHSETPLEQLTAAVWRETYTLMYRVLSDLAHAMELSHEVWDKIVAGTCPIPSDLDAATPTFLRIFRYDPTSGIAEQHTDMGLLTLCVCQGEGLQVQTRAPDGSKTWHEYKEPTLLIGQTLRILSGERVNAGVHRVVGNPNGRGSIVYALRPSTKHEVDLDVFPPGSAGNLGVVHMADLWKSIWTRVYNVNAPKEVREQQKMRLSQNKGKEVKHDTADESASDITNTKAAFEV